MCPRSAATGRRRQRRGGTADAVADPREALIGLVEESHPSRSVQVIRRWNFRRGGGAGPAPPGTTHGGEVSAPPSPLCVRVPKLAPVPARLLRYFAVGSRGVCTICRARRPLGMLTISQVHIG